MERLEIQGFNRREIKRENNDYLECLNILIEHAGTLFIHGLYVLSENDLASSITINVTKLCQSKAGSLSKLL